MPLRRLIRPLATLFVLAMLAWQLWPSQGGSVSGQPAATARPFAAASFLPAEAWPVIRTIQVNGRFPHRQDGSVFGNREGRLPPQPRGWYREYTVPTPGLSHRGARRIVTGGDPPREWYYTDDHYESFRAFTPAEAENRQ